MAEVTRQGAKRIISDAIAVTKAGARRMISSAIATYDRASRERQDSQHEENVQTLHGQSDILDEVKVYVDGQKVKAEADKVVDAARMVATEQNVKVLAEQSEILGEVKEYVDGEKRKADTEKLLGAARVAAQTSRDKKINRLVNYSRIGLPALLALLGKDWLVDLWHALLKHIH